MRGHLPLIAMRRAGQKPPIVFIDTDAGPRALPAWAQWQNCDGHPDIDIPQGQALSRIDWRPFVGLTVHVSGSDERRVRAVAAALIEAKAGRVVYSLLRADTHETVWVHDTDGKFGTQEETYGANAA